MNKDLFVEFDTLNTTEWIASIKKYLKDKPYESLYNWIEEGVSIQPFYRKEDLSAAEKLPIIADNDWLISESVSVDATTINKAKMQIAQALAGGVNALNLQITSGSPTLLATLLQGVFLNMVDINLSGAAIAANPMIWIQALVELPDAAESTGSISLSEGVDAALVLTALNLLPKWTFCNIESANPSEAVSPAAAIANALKIASSWITALTDAGLSLAQAQRQIRFMVSVDDDYFLSIARLRALKRLWLALLEAFDAKTACWPKIHVRSTYIAVDAPYWNMIAATTQALSAAVAQVYSIEICPVSDGAITAEFATRIARNVQHLLKMESHIDSIIDPAAGSYYIEKYSSSLAERAWFLFVA